jgi:hypothetical protein
MAAYTTIDDSEAYFQTQLYTGNGSANLAITLGGDTDMQPDFVWIKNRDEDDSHCLFDSVRGATEVLHADTTVEEATDADTLDSFTSDGFQVDADVKVNTNTEKYVAWCWKGGGSASSNSVGDITTSLSASSASGFSVVSYTGTGSEQTIGTGLSSPVKMIIIKRRTGTYDWATWNIGLTNRYSIMLNETDAQTDDGAGWFPAAGVTTTSTTFLLGNSSRTNGSSVAYIAHCFAAIQGFSKFGAYEGNGDADGTFVFCGFRPAFVMTKSIDSTSSWHMFDAKREGYNVDNDALEADATTVEPTTDMIDILSNGFKCRIATDPNVAETYIYAAFAEAPFVNSNGVPCNAR